MPTYAVGIGHNIADENLVAVSPQPEMPVVTPGRVEYPAAGDPYQDLHHVEFRWQMLEGDSEYRDVLTLFGLNNAETANVTVRVRDDNWLAWRVNGVAYRPIPGRDLSWRNFFPNRLVILVREIEEAT